MLIAKGIQLDCKNRSGKTALHLAVSNQFTECCRFLTDAGCDVNIQVLYFILTPLESLIHPLYIHQQDWEGDTALHYAVYQRRTHEIIQILASSGQIDFKLRNKSGFNVLHLAVLLNDSKYYFNLIRFK